MIESAEIRIQCPKCHFQNPKTIEWLRSRSEMFCDGCHDIIGLEGSPTGFRIFDIESARRKLQEALSNLPA